MMENIKPMDIEKRSFAIITELLGDTKLEEENELVIKRVIHTTADFDYVQNLVFSPHAVTKGLDALRAGCHIVTDTQMAKAGINKTILGRLGGEVHCFMSDADVAAEAKERGVTRAIVSMEKAAQLPGKCIFAIGNAPTALIALHGLIEEGKLDPALIMYDEPFAGLDPISLGGTANLIRKLNDALHSTSVIVTHDVVETFEIADYVYMINAGRVAAEGSPEELCRSEEPFVKQFINALPDGPVRFHYPANSIEACFGGEER